ncbi:hypothetical protein Droror1_Dr00004582 [Drosera rotundifolia]
MNPHLVQQQFEQMATQATSPPAPVSKSEGSSTTPAPRSSPTPPPPPPPPAESSPLEGKLEMEETVASAEAETKPDAGNIFEDFENEEDIQKYQKYEADYSRRVMAKYFSREDIYGGAVFEFEVVLGGETFKASRRPSVQSYADPSQYFMGDYSNVGSDLPEETSPAVSNGKKQAKASS